MDQVVTDKPDETRYELTIDGERVGLIDYVERDRARDLHHTEIDEQYSGRGLAGVLVAGAVADLRLKGLAMIPTCPYIQAWLRKHPDEWDIVPAEAAARFGLGS